MAQPDSNGLAEFMNLFCRVFGALLLLSSAWALLCAVAIPEGRTLNAVLGIATLGGGLAFLRVKRMSSADLSRWFGK